jgi:hypothetical protein
MSHRFERSPSPPPSFVSQATHPPSYPGTIRTGARASGSPDTLSLSSESDMSTRSARTVTEPRYCKASCSFVDYIGTSHYGLLVHYRLYSPIGAIKVKNPNDPEDPYVGRTLAVHVTPPHTSKNIRSHLSGLEDIQDDNVTSLFTDVFATSPIDDAVVVDFRDSEGVGSSPVDPMAFITTEQPQPPEQNDIPRRQGFQYTIKARYERE